MSRFVPPTIEEVQEYAREKGFGKHLKPMEFVCFYESKGWKVGKNKMVSWHGAAGGWASRNGWTEEKAQRPRQKPSQADEDCLRAMKDAALMDILKDGGIESQRLSGLIRLILAERAQGKRLAEMTARRTAQMTEGLCKVPEKANEGQHRTNLIRQARSLK